MRKEAIEHHKQDFVGAVFRGHNPKWSWAPESGVGAKNNGGRFNPKGTAALYTSLTQQGAWVEAQQSFKLKAQPLTICQYEVESADIIDLTNEELLLDCGIKPSTLSGAWISAKPKYVAPSQRLALDLIECGVAGIIVPSYAIAATADMKNVVFFDWSRKPPHRVCVVDDEHRLPSKPYS